LILVDGDGFDQIGSQIVLLVYLNAVAFLCDCLEEVLLCIYEHMLHGGFVFEEKLRLGIQVLLDDKVVADLGQTAFGLAPVETLRILPVETEHLTVA